MLKQVQYLKLMIHVKEERAEGVEKKRGILGRGKCVNKE